MYETFTFNGEKKDWLYIVEGRKKAPFPSLKRNTIEVPGHPGAYLQSTDLEPLIIEQPFGFIINNEEWNAIKDELSSWLYTSEPVALEFPDEPGRTYYAVVQDSIDDFERVSRTRMRQGTITFLCVDPYAYGEERSYDLSSASVIANEGTADTYPVFDLKVEEESTLIYIANLSNMTSDGDRRAIYLGTETDVDEETKPRKRLVLHDTMQSTSGWTGASEVDSGYVSGTMGVDGDNGFYVEDWGEEEGEYSGDWIGPSLKRDLEDPLKSFTTEIYLENRNEFNFDGTRIKGGVGIVEVYFRDVNGNKVAKTQFGDVHGNAAAINHFVFETSGKYKKLLANKPSGYNDFTGEIKIRRDSSYWYPEITKINGNGIRMEWKTPGQVIPGGGNVGENEVTSVQVAIRKWVGAQRIYSRIKEIKVWDTVGEFESPGKTVVHKFEGGDQIHIDTGTGLILVNGDEAIDLQHLKSEMFTLVEGINELDFGDNISGTVTYRNRYL